MPFSLPPALLFAVLLFRHDAMALPEPYRLHRRFLNTSSTITATNLVLSPSSIAEFDFTTHTTQLSPVNNGFRPLPPTASPAVSPDTGKDGGTKGDDQKDGTKSEDVKEGEPKTDDTKDETPTDMPAPSDYIPDPTKYSSRPTYGNYTFTKTSSDEPTSCITRKPDEASTVWVIMPNPSTVTITVGGNYTTSREPPKPEFTPPTYCPDQGSSTSTRYTPSFNPPRPSTTRRTSQKSGPITDAEPIFTSLTIRPPFFTIQPEPPPVTTIVTTSKNPVTTYTSIAPPQFPGNEAPTKQTVDPNNLGGPAQDPAPPNYLPIVTTIQGTPVQVQPSYVVVGGTTYTYPAPTGQAQPPNGYPPGALTPTNVVILDGGLITAIGSSIAAFDDRTIRYDGMSTITTEFRGETITLGSSITFDGTTIGGAGNDGTQYGIAGGVSVTQVGQSLGIISGTTLTVRPQAVVTTVIIGTYTIVVNHDGIVVAGTTLSYPLNPLTQVMTVGGVVLTQIGSSIMVIGGSTYTIQGTSRPLGTSANSRQTISVGSEEEASATGTTEPQSSPARSEPAETGKKKNAARALQPLYILLGLSLFVCLGSII